MFEDLPATSHKELRIMVTTHGVVNGAKQGGGAEKARGRKRKRDRGMARTQMPTEFTRSEMGPDGKINSVHQVWL